MRFGEGSHVVAFHARRIVDVAGAPLDSSYNHVHGHQRRIGLSDDARLPFSAIRPLQHLTIPRCVHDDTGRVRLSALDDHGDAALDPALSDRLKEVDLRDALGRNLPEYRHEEPFARIRQNFTFATPCAFTRDAGADERVSSSRST